MDTQLIKVARPHLVRASIAALLALAGYVTASYGDLCLGRKDRLAAECEPHLVGDRGLAILGGLLLLIGGIAAIRAVAAAIRKTSALRMGEARGATLALVFSGIGYALLLLSTLGAMGADLGGLLLGGAITGVIVGIAAQQTLANFFAGIVLLMARPFTVGETIVLRSGPLGGEYEGTVTDMGLFYVSLSTDKGPVEIPNAGVLSAAVGPGARTESKEEQLPKD